jgi:hypothetical protein
MVMPKCRLNPKLQCLFFDCSAECHVLKEIGQQTFGEPKPSAVVTRAVDGSGEQSATFDCPEVKIETKKRKGHTVEYYKVKK